MYFKTVYDAGGLTGGTLEGSLWLIPADVQAVAFIPRTWPHPSIHMIHFKNGTSVETRLPTSEATRLVKEIEKANRGDEDGV